MRSVSQREANNAGFHLSEMPGAVEFIHMRSRVEAEIVGVGRTRELLLNEQRVLVLQD